MEDNNPDSAASPATPGTGKSKLDTLSKEDLIKFTKKQMVVLQKVKARCADLEQEVEKLKNKSSGGADEAIIQELTERMDAVLLEKAETQQRLVLLRKENEKAKQEAKDALDKVTELQKQFDLSNVEHLKKIEDVKHELETVHSKHKEEAADFQKLLQEFSKKEQMLTAQFRQQLGHQNEVKELEEQFKLVRQNYEDQLSSLQQQLISSEEERRRETTMLKENQEAAVAECQKEIESLHGELLKIRIAHQEEVKELVDQLESAALEHEQERCRLLQVNEDLAEQLDQKENSLQDVEEEEETGIEWVKKHSEPLASGEQGEDEVINLKRMLKDLQSQHSILQDELTYLSNVNTGLELELQQAKDKFLHEKEELEFNINELQLCKEDNYSIATKCKSDLQTTNDHWEMALNQHEQELQVLKQRHQKKIVALEQTLLSTAEKEKGKALLEIQTLKEECEKLSIEKDEAVDSYEKTMEILRNVQSELGDTTGHFVKQYNAMKESNAAEIHELQQKLRVAFNEKDKLLESEARSQQDTSESDWENKKQELLSILHHKDTALRELEEKLAALNLEKDDVLAALKHSEVEVEKLRDACSTEQAQCVELQQNLTKDKTQIKAQEEELMNLKKERDHLQEELHLVRSARDSLSKFKDEIGDLEKSSQAVSKEKERLRNDFEEKLQQLTELQHRLEDLTKDKAQLQQRLDEAEMQLGTTFADKEDIAHQLKILESKLTVTCLEKEQKCSALKALEEDLTNLKNERDHLQEELNLARSDSNNLYKFKCETRDLEKSLQAVSQEKGRLRKDLEEKQQQLTDFQHRLEYLVKDNTQLQQRLDEAEIQMGANAAEKESICHQLEILENKVAELCLEKEQKCSDLKALEEDLTNLKKERDETGNLEKSFQAVSEEKERLRKDLEEKQQQLAEVRVHVFNYLQQEAGIEVFANNDQEVEDISVLVQKLWDKVMEGKRSALLQSDERIAQLQDDIESLSEEGRLQEVELRSFNDDLSKERTLLKENLEEVLSDKEGLQRDLFEMKNRNEKMRVENEALLAQIEAVSEKLKEIEKEKNDKIDQTVQQVVGDDEREKLLLLLAEKESELSNLQGEIASLQESKQDSSPAEEVIRELTDKIGNLEKEHKEKHEKMNKIKAVAVKAKKELDTTRKEVQALKEELELVKTERERLSDSVKDVIQAAESYKNLLAEYDKQTEQLDLEKERGDNCDRQIGELTKHLQAAVLQKDQLISEKEDQLTCLETLQMNVKQLEAQIVELQKGKSAVEKELEGEKLLKEHKIKDHSMSLKEIEDLQRHLQKQNQQLQQAVQELELLRKDAQQSSLMDMEMADYERLVKELNQNISDKESRIEEYEGEIKIQKQRQETLQEEISSMKSCLDQTEDKNTKIKQLLVKTKKELADTKKSEANQLAIQSSLKGELEASQQQLEDYKIQCADLTAERHKLQEQLRSMSHQLQRAKSAFQQKIAKLQEECTAAKAEQVSTASEFESYKVRVHNVLKQQKNKSASQNEKDAATQERECMERMMDQLKAKLQETQHSLQANVNELQALQSEHDTLLERHNKMLQETVAKEAELGDKLRSIQSENMVLKSEHAQTLSQLTDQNEALRNSFREQVRHLQEDHRKTVETLQQQVSKVEAQLFQLQKEASTTSPVPVQQTRKILQERKNADLLLFDLQSMAREEGEGMETTETESVSSSGTHIPSLELLNSPEPKMEPLVWQAEPTKEELAQKLNTATKSIEHINGLLHDTEATNAILMEQIMLLKSEVRRLERNQEREKSVANLEYLKNVLLQFIFLKSGSERQALLPVIHTMLQLSPEERSKLSAVAQGEEEAVVASRSSGWTSYLHSWSGIR
ncbi:GRIP and coiled-coil domain-containing protein 2-like [Acipenser oxyrinchus oxyrinchus]|uniref:GRIP and coiled-coil domain-containing protein 2-like n=1 Tax=Acipenser oxyrinchus oxyrinchus TaxID=40147 RepID=A0AAD8DCT2_ACIOX|nr:GRIP and coiled-coil domain-containing protein 2-like [Acipenser oxyrinchus oxyrinchus]